MRRLGELPAAFSGVLPCADCQGVRQTLDLFADGTFHWRAEYLGKPASVASDDIGRWLFASDGLTLLLFGGRETPVRFQLRENGVLRLLDLEGRPIESSLNYELRRMPDAFRPLEVQARLRGAYTYFADAAIFTDCATGRRMPVTAEGDALALEGAYTSARQGPSEAPRIALLEGRIVQRMPAEGPGPRATLVVQKFLRLAPAAETCPPPPTNAPFNGTRWRLTRLDGMLVTPSDKAGGAFLQVDRGEPRVAGSGSCNAFKGAVERHDDQVRFAAITATKRSCGRETSSQEKLFFEMLESARRWLIVGNLLELEDGEQSLLARFEAAPGGTAMAPHRGH